MRQRARWRRELDHAEALAQNIASGKVHRSIAADVYPKGATLSCRCGHSQYATSEQVGEYFQGGWPKHCGLTMVAEPVK